MGFTLIDSDDLIQPENHAMRIPVVLCLDTSGSMKKNGGLSSLNNNVREFYAACKQDVNRYGFDIAIVTFGIQGVNKEQDFRPAWNQEEVPVFECIQEGENMGTPMGQGIDLAIKGLEHRKETYKRNGLGYCQPWLVLISDGAPTDKESPAYSATRRRAIHMQRERKLQVISIGVGRTQDFHELASFVVDGKVLVSPDFSQFDSIFQTLAQSISVHSRPNLYDEPQTMSPVSILSEELADEGISIRIEDFGRDDG